MKIVIIGCGRLGAGLAQTLTLRGHAVTAVDRDPAAFARLPPAVADRAVTGMGFDREVLLRAGIEQADGLAAVTGDDRVNAVVARVARQLFRVPRVVARLYDPRTAEIYRRLGIQTIAPVTWGVHRMADLLCASPLNVVQSLGSGDADLVEVDITPHLVGRTIDDLTIPGEAHVVAIVRRGATILPAHGAALQPGDRLYAVVLAASAHRLTALLEP